MRSIRLQPNRRFPAIPAVSNELRNHTEILTALREAVQVGKRDTSDVLNSYVRVKDLVDMGFATLDSGVLVPSDFSTGGGGSDDQTAAEVSYDNTTSGLAATDVQAAIDEVAGGGGGGGAEELDDLTDVDTTTFAPKFGDRLVFDGSLWVPNTQSRIILQESDCDYLLTTNTDLGGPWRAALSSGSHTMTSEDGAPGIWRLTKGTGTHQANFLATNTLFTMGRGPIVAEFRFRISAIAPNNSTTNAFLFHCGFHNTGSGESTPFFAFGAGGGATADGSVWRARSRDNSSTSNEYSAVSYSADTWYLLRIEVPADGSSFSGYIDGDLIVTKSAELPPVGTLLRPWAQIWTAGGATSPATVNLDVDYVRALQVLTTSR